MSGYVNRGSGGVGTSTGTDGDVERHETSDLISSAKVEGTSVYSMDGDKLGSIHSVMLGKRDGKAAYAVVSFGGFLGLGQSHYPVPWGQLTYSRDYDGYVTNLTEERLRGAPSYRADEEDTYYGRNNWRAGVDSYYV